MFPQTIHNHSPNQALFFSCNSQWKNCHYYLRTQPMETSNIFLLTGILSCQQQRSIFLQIHSNGSNSSFILHSVNPNALRYTEIFFFFLYHCNDLFFRKKQCLTCYKKNLFCTFKNITIQNRMHIKEERKASAHFLA